MSEGHGHRERQPKGSLNYNSWPGQCICFAVAIKSRGLRSALENANCYTNNNPSQRVPTTNTAQPKQNRGSSQVQQKVKAACNDSKMMIISTTASSYSVQMHSYYGEGCKIT